MIAREAVIAEARTWIDTPYRHQARLKGIGCDCIGLVGGVALACAVPGAAEWAADRSLHDYGRQPDPKALMDGCARFLDRIELADAQPGDVLVLRFEREPQHFALLTATEPLPRMLHALARLRRVREHIFDEVWRRRVVAAFRFRGLACS